jgi:hypothetical protein
MPLSELPKRYKSARRYCNALRELVESAVAEKFGEITITQALRINRLVSAEQAVRVTEQIIRQNDGHLNPKDLIDAYKSLCSFREKRDSALKDLDIEVDLTASKGPNWDIIDQKQVGT